MMSKHKQIIIKWGIGDQLEVWNQSDWTLQLWAPRRKLQTNP